ncbi:DNA primase [Anaplasma centrale str. Israel]|uniref:DNA primase n=1 Tax=Anaplasma centrale (strain Israel) TaxID=574556 RepID=D1ASA1_ANACI|nr:DNA primase [Anaplasma centrale]ACZ49354.1 DNA primase [Anaplasma centrale str. Israel]
MSGSYQESDHVTLIREKVRLLDVVSKRIKLIKRGNNQYVGLCPFHAEKTPSFHVNCSNDMFYCFGCGVHGDVVQFVSDIDGLSFMEAIEYLAQVYGVSLPAKSGRGEADSLYELMDYAARWFVEQLSKSPAVLAYLKARSIDDRTVRKFRLGYVPVSGIRTCFASSHIGFEKVRDAGLLTKNLQDCLYNRLVFPICSATGRVIAFGGRSVSDRQTPKYLNSAENVLFKKRESLYGLHLALASAKKLGRIIAVEGYMDVLILSQLGISNVVGLLGTAMTEAHLRYMWDVVPEIVVWMDGDDAGVNASIKIAHLALSIMKSGQSVRFVISPPGKDPYDVCVSSGPDSAQALVEHAKLLSEFVWDHELARANIPSSGKIMPEQCMVLERRIQEYTSKIQDAHIAKYYRNFFYQQIKALQREQYHGKGGTSHGSARAIEQGLKSSRLGGVSLQACAGENYQMRVIYAIVECPKLLYDVTVFEQFASLDFTGGMQALQQHIVDIREMHGEELSKADLVRELCSRRADFEQVLRSIREKMSAIGCTFEVKDGSDGDVEKRARREWEKLMLSKQLGEIQEQIVKLRLEGRYDVALNLSEHAREVDDKLRSLWRC